MPVVLGLDIGIGSCGWGLADIPDVDDETGEIAGDFAIVALGARCFDVPEVPKTKELKNAARRLFRGQRRVVRRRRQRIAEVRAILAAHGLPIAPPLAAAADKPSKDRQASLVWALRAEGLDRPLKPEEWARVMVHLAKHRGFKSNSKRDHGDNKSDAGKMLAAVKSLEGRAVGWRTVGEMLAQDPVFAGRKRNRPGDYGHTLPRALVEAEARRLFDVQRRLGNPHAGHDLEEAFRQAAFFQRPLQESLSLVGPCRFLPDEIRASRHAPSFERFRLLSRLTSLTVEEPGRSGRPLGDEERRRGAWLFASQKEITFKTLRKALKLPDGARFGGVDAERESKPLASCQGSVALRGALGEDRFRVLAGTAPELLDAAATALAFFDAPERIAGELEAAGLAADDVAALMADSSLARWAGLSGVGHISTKACRALNPHLEAGLVYSDACQKVGWDHAQAGLSRLDDLRNPVVRKVVRECLRQIKVVTDTYGMPDAVHLEMARDLGKSPKDRDAIRKANEDRAADRRNSMAELRDLLPRAFRDRDPNSDEILRYELWKEQNHRCPYPPDDGAYISPEWLVATDNRVQVDHILPYSRSGDDSYRNKVLCRTSANQLKRRQTPWEWFGHTDAALWALFEAHVSSLKTMHKEKRRKLLMRSFAEREDAYKARHLNDTRHAMRVLRHELTIRYPDLAAQKDSERRLFVRPGAITAMVRHGWGVNALKKDGILGDRDHALDAVVVACTSESLLGWLTRFSHKREEAGQGRTVPALPTPLGASPEARETFRRLLEEKAMGVFVSRPETRRGRGPLHAATLYGCDQTADGGEVQYERKAVEDLKPEDLERLKGGGRAKPLCAALAAWLAKAERLKIKPKKLLETDPPRMPRDGENAEAATGPVLRRVRLERKDTKAGIKLRRGDGIAHADNDSMVRVDVYAKGGRFFLAPVYAWQVGTLPAPPNRAIVAHKPETEWSVIDGTFAFRFSLHPGAYVRVTNRSGEVFEGYYAGTDRGSATLTLNPATGVGKPGRPGTKLLAEFRKYHVDRLGNRHEIEKEPLLWHGVALS